MRWAQSSEVYAATSLAPILLIVLSVAGVVFGDEAAHLALSAQSTGLMEVDDDPIPRSAQFVREPGVRVKRRKMPDTVPGVEDRQPSLSSRVEPLGRK